MKSIKAKDINKSWFEIDASEKTLGRLSTEVAMHLMGKNKPVYSPNLDCGDFVVIVNSTKVKLSGKKENQKKYYRHSGYPGGLYSRTASDLRQKSPNQLIKNAVFGMLPKTKMGKNMLKKLYIYPDKNHPYSGKFK